MREAEIEELGVRIRGKLISNLRYAEDTALCAHSQEEAEQLLTKVNEAGRERLIKLNGKKTKLLKVGNTQPDATVRMDGE